MDSEHPRQHEYHSQPANRQDAQTAAPSSLQSTPVYTDPPATYQPSYHAASAPAVEFEVEEGVEDVAGSIDEDGPITVPVLGIQPLTQYREQAPDVIPGEPYQVELGDPMAGKAWDDGAAWQDNEVDDDEGDTRDDRRSDVGYAVEDALNALDVDIALGFAGEPMVGEDAFAFRERSWDSWKRTRRTALTLLALTAMLVVAVLGATLAASYMQHATRDLTITPPQPTVSNFSGGLVIQSGSQTVTPTPEAPKYQIGAWMSNNAPSGGSVKVFVRLTHDIKPLAHVPVTLTAQIGDNVARFGPTKTDDYGLATFTVHFGGASGTPVFITATAKVGNQTLTADTVFVPI